MAFLEFKNVRIVGISVGVPKHVEQTVSTTSEYDSASFVETTGVKEKRYDNNLTTSDLCLSAAERQLADLGWDSKDIDALIFVSQTPDYILPATSCVLHGKLGLKKDCYCMDISLGCSGWVYGLSSLMALMQGGTIRRALLLAGDARKQAYEEPDQLFGFAGTSTALEFGEFTGSYKFHLGSDGSGYDAIIRPEGGCRNQLNEHSLDLIDCEDGRKRHALQTRMKGMDVFAFGITTAPKSIKKLAEHYNIDLAQTDYFIFHQANYKMNETIRKKLKIESEKVPYSMYEFGNTSSASIPLTIATKLKTELCSPRQLVCCGFGVGLSWGTLAFKSENIIISDLVEL